jgi:gamma-glutamyl hercynylcysteine S-oxide synthase
MALADLESRTGMEVEFRQAREQTAELFSALQPAALYERPIAERHRVIFYVGHLEAFDYIQICRQSLHQPALDPTLDRLFQAGIDPDSAHLPTDTAQDWPSLEQVTRYVERARRAVDEAINEASEEAIHMALEHRLMHLETLAYMWHNFPLEWKRQPADGTVDAPGEGAISPQNDWLPVPAGNALLGKKRDGSFGWDNEYDEHRVQVPAFRIQRYKVTNGDYLRFVQAGAPKPHFWTERNGTLYLRGMFTETPLPLDWPVYVTHQEAEQYAKWLGKSLPTEAQYHRAAFSTPTGEIRLYPWGNAIPDPSRGNFDFKRWDPEPVHTTPGGRSAFGLEQLSGNGWEWTQTVFAPFAGFKAVPAYPGYSANFFDGEHYVLKGGSPRTAARLLRRSFRNWFRPDYPYVYATFRCVEN